MEDVVPQEYTPQERESFDSSDCSSDEESSESSELDVHPTPMSALDAKETELMKVHKQMERMIRCTPTPVSQPDIRKFLETAHLHRLLEVGVLADVSKRNLSYDMVFQETDKDWEADIKGDSTEKKKKRNMERIITTVITHPEWLLTPGRRLHLRVSLTTRSIYVCFEHVCGMITKSNQPLLMTQSEWNSFIQNAPRVLHVMESLEKDIWNIGDEDQYSTMPGDKIIKLKMNCADSVYTIFRYNKQTPKKYYVELIKLNEGLQLIDGEMKPAVKKARFLMNAPCMVFFMKEVLPEIKPSMIMWDQMMKLMKDGSMDCMPSWLQAMKLL